MPDHMPSSFDDDKEFNENGWQKVSRKLREEPLVPLGTLLTCVAFTNAWFAMRRGDHVKVQRMFRARVGAQAFTVMAIVAGGAYYGKDREKRKELIKLEAEQRAAERHQKWLRELEIRDEEDKALQEHIKRRRERKSAREDEAEDVTPAKERLTAETAPDADEPAPPREKKPVSPILAALANARTPAGNEETKKQTEELTASDADKAEVRKKGVQDAPSK